MGPVRHEDFESLTPCLPTRYRQGDMSCAQVGAWMLYTTWELVMCIKNGTIETHPMFCYEGAATQPSSAGPRSVAPEVMLPAHQPRSAAV